MKHKLLNDKKNHNEYRTKIVLYTTSLILLIILSVGFVISSIISWKTFEKLSVEASKETEQLKILLDDKNIENTKTEYLKKMLKGGFFKEQDTTLMLYNLFKYEIYITVTNGEEVILETQLLTSENQGLSNIANDSVVEIELRETMLKSLLPDSIAEIGSITGGDQADSLDSDNLKPHNFSASKTFTKADNSLNDEFRISSVKYSFSKQADTEYKFVFSRMMPSRIANIKSNNPASFTTFEIGEGFTALTGFILG